MSGLGNRRRSKAALGLFAIGRSKVLPGGEFVIERGYLVQSIDDLFVSHCGCVAARPFRFLAEKRGIGGDRGVRERFIHVDLTLGLHGAIQPFATTCR